MTAAVHIERCPRRIRAVFQGKTIAASSAASLVWRTGWPPVPWYYFPEDDVDSQFLAATDHIDSHETMGEARYWSVIVGDRVAENAAFGYPDSPIIALRDLRSLNFGQMDAWFEEDEEIFVHPRDPYHRVDVLYSSRHIEVSVNGVTVADSRRARLLFETNLPTRYYLPKLDVRMDLLTVSDTSSACPYKGVASYWSLTSGEVPAHDVAWGYRTPLLAASKVTDLVCFYNEKVDITVDGVAQKRPKTGFGLALDERLQPRQRFVPLTRDRIEIRPRIVDRLRNESEPALAAHAARGDDALSFVIINRLGSCGLVRPGVEEESEVAARETVPPSRRLRT